MNIIVPLAGEGKRFTDAGYPEKPFVDINGKSMIETVLESLPRPWLEAGVFTFIAKKEYFKRLTNLCKIMGINYQIISTEGTTKGAACSVLLSSTSSVVELDKPLIIINGDQIVKFSLLNFNTIANQLQLSRYANEVSGVIPVFRATESKWSYVSIDEYNQVREVVEKNPISPWATCGIYYWSRTDAFFECADNMIFNKRMVNNEYYVAPVYNEVIQYGFKNGTVLALEVDEMVSLGTPEDVQKWINR